MAFTVDDASLRLLFEQNSFELPDPKTQPLVLVGLRGSQMTRVKHYTGWNDSLSLKTAAINYRNPRCTVVMWDQTKKQVRGMLASTVPNIKHIRRAKANNGKGANMNLTGRFTLVEGKHPWSGRTSHRALRQIGNRPYRRTADDLDYDGNDRVEFGNPADNLHCGYFSGPDASSFESAGCTVIDGFPKTKSRPRSATGAWAQFEAELYKTGGAGLAQKDYVYAILNGSDAQNADEASDLAALSPRVRYGSSGPLVEVVQAALVAKGFLNSTPDGRTGPNTIGALLRAQEQLFGTFADDGICGPATATALDIDPWTLDATPTEPEAETEVLLGMLYSLDEAFYIKKADGDTQPVNVSYI